MENKGYVQVGIGTVAKDKPEDTVWIDVYLVEVMPVADGDVNAKQKINVTNEDSSKSNVTKNVSKSMTIRAKWLPLHNSNRASAPDVVSGERVQIWQDSGNSDIYYWTSMALSQRKKEKVIFTFSNKHEVRTNEASPALGEDLYYLQVDTRNQMIHLHTADNEGEKSRYDFIINTKEGIVTFEDVQGNFFKLESVDGILTAHINNDVIISHDRDMKITTGKSHTESIGSFRKTDIKENCDTTIGGDMTKKVSGNITQEAGSTATYKSGGVTIIKGSLVQIN